MLGNDLVGTSRGEQTSRAEIDLDQNSCKAQDVGDVFPETFPSCVVTRVAAKRAASLRRVAFLTHRPS